MAAFGFQKAVPLHMNISLFLLSALYYDNIWFGIFLFNVKLMTLCLDSNPIVSLNPPKGNWLLKKDFFCDIVLTEPMNFFGAGCNSPPAVESANHLSGGRSGVIPEPTV